LKCWKKIAGLSDGIKDFFKGQSKMDVLRKEAQQTASAATDVTEPDAEPIRAPVTTDPVDPITALPTPPATPVRPASQVPPRTVTASVSRTNAGTSAAAPSAIRIEGTNQEDLEKALALVYGNFTSEGEYEQVANFLLILFAELKTAEEELKPLKQLNELPPRYTEGSRHVGLC
jgi:hypothetical protein